MRTCVLILYIFHTKDTSKLEFSVKSVTEKFKPTTPSPDVLVNLQWAGVSIVMKVIPQLTKIIVVSHLYSIANAHDKIEQVGVEKKHWDYQKRAVVTELKMVYNIVNDYNKDMNHVDRSDQHQTQYYSYARWLRNRKWTWAIFLHLHRMVCSNSYIRYLKVEKRAGNEKPMSHRRFLELLCEKQCAPPPEQSPPPCPQ